MDSSNKHHLHDKSSKHSIHQFNRNNTLIEKRKYSKRSRSLNKHPTNNTSLNKLRNIKSIDENDLRDLATIKQLTDQANELKLNLNCTDTLGRDVLRIAIENEHMELLQFLVALPNLDLKDCILHAINEDNVIAVEIILHAQNERDVKKDLQGLLGRFQSSSFTPDINGIILAAHRDNYVILKLLLDRGERIYKPHDLRCACNICTQARRENGLQHSKLRINTYRALTSPSFIILTSNDPILTAFELSWELKKLAQTRSSVELSIILNHDTGADVSNCHFSGPNHQPSFSEDISERMQLSRLKLAIRYEQKQLTTIGVLCSLFPLMATFYMLAPNSKMGSMMKKPFIKFLCHSSSYLSFLGFVWQQMKKLYTCGLRAYLMDMWNLVDFVMNALYVATISLRTVAWARIVFYDEPRYINRGQWDSFDPVLVSECLFAAANIVSTLKLVYVFTVSPQLGPLQISLGRMLYDIFRFFCVYFLVLVAFAFGFNQLYWFYAKNRARNCKNVHFTLEEGQKDVYDYCITRGTYFTNLFEIVQSLYWSAYGLIDLTSFNLEYPHVFTEFVGKLTFGTYSYIAFIVLLNMLIAMMNSSYEQIVLRIKQVKECEARYQSVMRELTKRYIMQKLRSSENDTVSADDLSEIKGDISAFRHELLDILKSNGMKIPAYHKTVSKLRRGREVYQLSEIQEVVRGKKTKDSIKRTTINIDQDKTKQPKPLLNDMKHSVPRKLTIPDRMNKANSTKVSSSNSSTSGTSITGPVDNPAFENEEVLVNKTSRISPVDLNKTNEVKSIPVADQAGQSLYPTVVPCTSTVVCEEMLSNSNDQKSCMPSNQFTSKQPESQKEHYQQQLQPPSVSSSPSFESTVNEPKSSVQDKSQLKQDISDNKISAYYEEHVKPLSDKKSSNQHCKLNASIHQPQQHTDDDDDDDCSKLKYQRSDFV
ncbi:Transient receptor potential-gamma protein [Schistosoma japonicum]|nr:Transient receptor potential-gamma protein [Schistosoma japonicum]